MDLIDIPYFNEACTVCGVCAEIHGITPDTKEENKHKFVRCNPPMPAYGIDHWELNDMQKRAYFLSILT